VSISLRLLLLATATLAVLPARAAPVLESADRERAQLLARAEILLHRGQTAQALDALAPARGVAWPCSDVTRILAARALLDLARPEEALAELAPVLDAGGSPHRGVAAWVKADALRALHRPESAAAYAALRGQEDDPRARQRAMVREAQSLEETGDAAAASAAWMRAAKEALDEAPPDALLRAEKLGSQAGAPVKKMSARERLDWGLALRKANHHERAVEVLQAVEPELTGASLSQAMTARASSLYDLRRNDAARDACSVVIRRFPGTEDAATCHLVAARACWRQGDLAALRVHVDAALGDPRLSKSSQRPELQLVSAGALADEGRLEPAAAALSSLAQSTPSKAGEARWRLAWIRARQSRFDEARREFEKLAVEQRGNDLERVARLSVALMQERLGEDPTGTLEDVVRAWPFSRQGAQALARLRELRTGVDLAPLEKEIATSGTRLVRPPALALPEPAATRHALLASADLFEWDVRELEAARPKGKLSDAFAFELARARANAGDAPGALALAQGYFSSALGQPSRLSPREFWEVVYPLPRRELVLEEAADHHVDPALCAAIIRSESAWDEQARSWADARGLMQLLVKTAKPLARREGVPEPTADDLFDPRLNVALGTRHLHELVEMFRGDLDAAIASYNAGEDKVTEWWTQFERDGVPPHERAERIPYRETRQYVRRVREAMGWYAWLLSCEDSP